MDTEKRDEILAECRDLMAKAKYDGSKTEQFCDAVSDILQDCIDQADNLREITYEVEKHLDCVAFRLNVSGSRIDPLAEGRGAQERRRQNVVNRMLLNPQTSVTVSYTSGWNHIVVKSQR